MWRNITPPAKPLRARPIDDLCQAYAHAPAKSHTDASTATNTHLLPLSELRPHCMQTCRCSQPQACCCRTQCSSINYLHGVFARPHVRALGLRQTGTRASRWGTLGTCCFAPAKGYRPAASRHTAGALGTTMGAMAAMSWGLSGVPVATACPHFSQAETRPKTRSELGATAPCSSA